MERDDDIAKVRTLIGMDEEHHKRDFVLNLYNNSIQ